MHTNNNKNISNWLKSTPLILIVYEPIWLLANKRIWWRCYPNILENSIIKCFVLHTFEFIIHEMMTCEPLCVSAINISSEIGEHKYIHWLQYSLFPYTSSLFASFFMDQRCIQIVSSSFHCALCSDRNTSIKFFEKIIKYRPHVIRDRHYGILSCVTIFS